jgi:ComF family protein
LFPFKGFVREIIHDYKFSSATSLRRPLVRCLELAYGSASWEGAHDLLTHVPTSPEALRQRGFDHAAELAQGLSRRLNIPWVPVLAKKTGFKRQSDLSRASRLRNTREAFSVENAPGLEGRRILLVDDVLTTGATVQACSRAMLAAGAMSVDVLALARSV